ncbi:hypothetical protein NECAME_16183 [Necator americanus]|uniref:Uncharacterized protein n=1 Tax=Necator americanus TaxID=51031 RepID=W2TXW6_NECAM|nr:hypothetical protein NECAME_16183 [Necator americanus]ETN86708.1 hypothetical protein NECAME_16183 [Necator americanus]
MSRFVPCGTGSVDGATDCPIDRAGTPGTPHQYNTFEYCMRVHTAAAETIAAALLRATCHAFDAVQKP